MRFARGGGGGLVTRFNIFGGILWQRRRSFMLLGQRGRRGEWSWAGGLVVVFQGGCPQKETQTDTQREKDREEGERQRKRKEIERYMALKNGEYYAVKKFRRPGFGPVVRAPSR